MVAQSELNITIDMLGVPTILIDVKPGPRFSWLKMNTAAEQHMGCSIEDLGSPDLDNIEGLSQYRIKQRKEFNTLCMRCFEDRGPVNYEYKYRRPDGNYRWTRSSMVPIFDSHGKIKQIMESFFDIIELIESQEKIKIAIDSIGEPIMILDVKPDDRFAFSILNRAAEKYFSVSNEAYIGLDLDNFEGLNAVRIAQRKQSIAVSKRCIATRAPVVSETKHLTRDGSYRWGRNTNAPIFGTNGDVHQIMVSSVDITELVETRNRLEDALTKTLSGFVTICANCKKIRHNDEWQPIELYASEQMDYHNFSHGLCTSCARELYDDDALDAYLKAQDIQSES